MMLVQGVYTPKHQKRDNLMGQNAAVTVANVLLHHLTSLKVGELDEVMLDYTDGSVLMSPDQIFRGLAEIRAFFQAAIAGFPPEMLEAITLIRQDLHDEVAYITWNAGPFAKMATDTFVIRNGKLAVQTFLTVS